MSYFDTGNKQECCGCEACEQVCPKQAIIMKPDLEGFLYPKIIKEKCVDCNLCKKVCPIWNKINISMLDDRRVFSMHVNDDDLLYKSSSGGAFSIIAQEFCDNQYVIFGARYDDDFNVYHDYIENINEICKFRKSKYVQSEINNSYRKVLEFLNDNKKVLFSGTPCQVVALKKFLGKEYENLLCVDIICHGVPSPKVWKIYLKYIENKYNSKIKSINFREKENYMDIYTSRNMKILLDNGKVIIENSEKNLYLRGFHNKLLYRKSCELCKFASPIRYSDITIADCWGIEKIDDSRNSQKGESMIVVNTKKGIDLCKKITLNECVNSLEVSFDFAINNNEQFRQPTKMHKNRDYFYNNIDSKTFDKNINSCIKYSMIKKIKLKIPVKLKIRLKNIINK